MNVDGVEVFHPTHRYSDETLLSAMCKENNFIETGGSDFHGWKKNDFFLGRVGLNAEKYNDFNLKN